jgi:hypothetical protein
MQNRWSAFADAAEGMAVLTCFDVKPDRAWDPGATPCRRPADEPDTPRPDSLTQADRIALKPQASGDNGWTDAWDVGQPLTGSVANAFHGWAAIDLRDGGSL